jgi:hypothetical protein
VNDSVCGAESGSQSSGLCALGYIEFICSLSKFLCMQKDQAKAMFGNAKQVLDQVLRKSRIRSCLFCMKCFRNM